MTAYPECHLARELELCYATIAMVTDYDVGVEGSEPVAAHRVVEVFAQNNARFPRGLKTETVRHAVHRADWPFFFFSATRSRRGQSRKAPGKRKILFSETGYKLAL